MLFIITFVLAAPDVILAACAIYCALRIAHRPFGGSIALLAALLLCEIVVYWICAATRMPDEGIAANLIAMALWFLATLAIMLPRHLKKERKRRELPQFTSEELKALEATRQPWLSKADRF